VLLLVLAAIADAAPGGKPPAHAAELASYKDAVSDGTIAFRDGRYPVARAAFERAYAIHPDPVLLFNIASCWRREGQSVQAVAAYLRFLDHAPSGDPRRRLATETVATLEAELAATTAEPAPSRPAPAPPPAPLPVDREPRIMIDDVAVEPEAALATTLRSGAPLRRRNSPLRPLGVGLSTVGVVMLAAGGVEAMRARSIEHDLEDLRGRPWGHAEAEQYRNGEQTARRALIFGVAGAVLVGGGVTLVVVGRSRERPMRLGAAPTRGGAAVSLVGGF
jgi:tetratricopeptide (TPR) repeat protein